MDIKVYNKDGKDSGRTVSMDAELFESEPNDHVIYLDVKQILANKRQGTHQSKERAQVRGSTKKIKRQKGTGTARAGDIKNPIFRGGGRVFGPRPRDYAFKVNKKMKRLARRSALGYKVQDEAIRVMEGVQFDKPSTKDYAGMLKAMGLDNAKTLFVTAEVDKGIYLSARNLQKANVMPAAQLNTYDVMNADTVLVAEDAVEKLKEILKAK